MISNKTINLILTELLNIPLVFITRYYFKVPEDVRLKSTYFFIMKNPSNERASTNCNILFIKY